MKVADRVLADLKREGQPRPEDARFLMGFFKTGDGQYGAGDKFSGVRVPAIRRVARRYRAISLQDTERLLESPIHEVRLTAAIVMTEQALRADDAGQRALFDLYLRRTDRINNWDIVDVSCRGVVGGYLLHHPEARGILRKLARSSSLWERRIAIVSTWQFMRAGQLDETFAVAELLLHDKHDLIHKAVGWMLREAGKRDNARLKAFLRAHAATMPRTALRYAIERFTPQDRALFMAAAPTAPSRARDTSRRRL